MSNVWMVRSSGGARIEEFKKGQVSIGFADVGNMADVTSPEQIRKIYEDKHPDIRPGEVSSAVAMLHKFRSVMKVGDHVVTYDPASREYSIGEITSDYLHVPGEHSHVRKVQWSSQVGRDALRVSSRNSLGSTLTLFMVPPDAWTDLTQAAKGATAPIEEEDEREDLEQERIGTRQNAHELIKDKIARLDDVQMEELAAAILRAMGFKTRVSPKGSDRGVDVLASPDGLGLQEPRIKVEVKHRRNTLIGSQDLRSFLGGLRPGDRGLYVSTGGFTKEAKYEAERANTPITLLDLDDLAELTVTHYENFDLEGRALVSLVKVYWPAE